MICRDGFRRGRMKSAAVCPVRDNSALHMERIMSFLSSPATSVLILVNIGFFLLETVNGGSTRTGVALKYGALYGPYVKKGEYYRIFTSMFLHFGVLHLLLNMYALSVLGPAVDRACGTFVYLAVYFIAGAAGNALTLYFEARMADRRRPAVSAGASGCIFGLLGACLVLAAAGYGFSLRSILTTLAVNLAYGFSAKQINMLSHIGGFLGGAAATAFFLFLL